MAWKLPLFTKQDKKVKIGKDSTVNHKIRIYMALICGGNLHKRKKLVDFLLRLHSLKNSL